MAYREQHEANAVRVVFQPLQPYWAVVLWLVLMLGAALAAEITRRQQPELDLNLVLCDPDRETSRKQKALDCTLHEVHFLSEAGVSSHNLRGIKEFSATGQFILGKSQEMYFVVGAWGNSAEPVADRLNRMIAGKEEIRAVSLLKQQDTGGYWLALGLLGLALLVRRQRTRPYEIEIDDRVVKLRRGWRRDRVIERKRIKSVCFDREEEGDYGASLVLVDGRRVALLPGYPIGPQAVQALDETLRRALDPDERQALADEHRKPQGELRRELSRG